MHALAAILRGWSREEIDVSDMKRTAWVVDDLEGDAIACETAAANRTVPMLIGAAVPSLGSQMGH